MIDIPKHLEEKMLERKRQVDMTIKEKTNHWLPKLLAVQAIVIYPYVFYAGTLPSKKLRAHEWAHVEQVKRHGWLRFYTSYLLYYVAARVQGRGHFKAYWLNPYEMEARDAERITG